MPRLSIRTKLPLAIAAAVLLVGAAVATTAWFVIQRTSDERAEARLMSLAQQVSRTFGTQAATIQQRAAGTARRPELAALLNEGGLANETAFRELLRPAGGAALIVRTEIRDPSGAVRLVHPSGTTALEVLGDEWRDLTRQLMSTDPSRPGRDAVHGRLRVVTGELLYPVVAAIPEEPGGFYVEWRRPGLTPQMRESVARFLGDDASLLIGNDDGSAWSDWGTPIEGTLPPMTVGETTSLVRPGRGETLAAVVDIPNTPWNAATEFPRRDIDAPARRFLGAVGLIAAVTTLIGALLGWGLGRRIAAPVHSLTQAADAIAAGDITRRVPAQGDDEFGRLGRSFNTMADEVQRSRDTLEVQVAERTRELREARESLARREKLTLIAHMAGGVGHEIRNPLGVMSNAIYYLEAIQKDAPKNVRDYLALLRQQVNITAKIVNDLLDMSRTTPAHRQVTSVKDLVEPRLARLNGVAVVRDLPDTLPSVEVDPVHAGQVLDNLLDNASQSMGGAGTIHVGARETADGFVRIDVRDSGPGIRAEHIDKIFEPLFTTKARGIGLGLAVSKSLAQANGGDLRLVSQPGEGACFALTLPIAGSTT